MSAALTLARSLTRAHIGSDFAPIAAVCLFHSIQTFFIHSVFAILPFIG